LWLPSADMAVQRVRDRVSRGGHDVPEETIRRRYERGIHNFFHLYQPLADHWKFFNNANPKKPRQIAEFNNKIEEVNDSQLWEKIRKEFGS
jgi:predicted ABC-type ATPase